jgi:hypothetical protein
MANAPQGTLTYAGGITPAQVLYFSASLQHGLTPNIISARIIIPPTGFLKNGNLILSYGSTTITLPNCTVAKIERPDDEKLEWDITILDRRWRWKNGSISGLYNQRWKSGTELRKETIQTPSQLAAICLRAMGETGYVLGAITAFDGLSYPEISWNCVNPSQALQALCERYGCRAIYRWSTNSVWIVQVGVGAQLDVSGDIPYEYNSLTWDPPEVPGTIVVQMGPTSVQSDTPLDPVGVDVDATIRSLPKLSYAPDGTFRDAKGNKVAVGNPPPDLKTGVPYIDKVCGYWPWLGLDLYGQPAPYLRHLAAENVYRLWRIHPPQKFTGLNAAWGDSRKKKAEGTAQTDLETFPDVSQVSAGSWLWRLALQSEQNDRLDKLASPLNSQYDEFNQEVSSSALPAWVYGQYYSANDISGNVLLDSLDEDGNFIAGSGLKKLDPSLIVSTAKLNASTAPGYDAPTTVSRKVASSGFYNGSFTIIPEWGLVKFSEPVFQLCAPKKDGTTWKLANGDPLPGSYNNYPATLWLRTRMFLRDPQTRGWVRAERVRVLDKSNPVVEYAVRDDIFLKMTYRFKGPPNTTVVPPTFNKAKIESNWDVVSAAADAYLDEIEARYQNRTPQSVVYIGFIPLDLDGAIREITWYTDEQGFARTRVSRDQEYLVWHQDYAERRLAERTRAILNHKPDPTPPQQPNAGGVF